MTFQEPNSATPYVNGDTFEPAAANIIIDNSRAEFLRDIGQSWHVYFPPNATTGVTTPRIPCYFEDWRTICCVAAADSGYPKLFSLTKTSTEDWKQLANYTTLTQGHQFVIEKYAGTSSILMFCTTTLGYFYFGTSGGYTLSETAFPDSATFTALGPILHIVDGDDYDVYLAPGLTGSDYGCIVEVGRGSSAATLHVNGTESLGIRRLATDGDGTIVGVGGSGTSRLIAISTNYGVTWTWTTYPTLTGGLSSGFPSITYDSTRSLFITSMLSGTGIPLYCSSPDGSSWGDWHDIPLDAGAGSIPANSADIFAIDGTWVILRPYAPSLTDSSSVQAFASYDGGASWYDISPTQTIETDDGIWCVQLGNRIGISTNNFFALSGPITVNSSIASEVYSP